MGAAAHCLSLVHSGDFPRHDAPALFPPFHSGAVSKQPLTTWLKTRVVRGTSIVFLHSRARGGVGLGRSLSTVACACGSSAHRPLRRAVSRPGRWGHANGLHGAWQPKVWAQPVACCRPKRRCAATDPAEPGARWRGGGMRAMALCTELRSLHARPPAAGGSAVSRGVGEGRAAGEGRACVRRAGAAHRVVARNLVG